jgi:hypothetical protein
MGLFRRLVRKALAKIAVESGGPNLKQKMSAPLSAMADHVERLDRRVSEHPYAPGRAWCGANAKVSPNFAAVDL